jgi:hypothetical protein
VITTSQVSCRLVGFEQRGIFRNPQFSSLIFVIDSNIFILKIMVYPYILPHFFFESITENNVDRSSEIC